MGLDRVGNRILELLHDNDSFLGTMSNFMFGRWQRWAHSWVDSEDDHRRIEINVRNRLTLWGPDGNVRDYGSEQWNGLVGDYFIPRYRLFFSTAISKLKNQAV